MAIPAMEFSRGVYKVIKVFGLKSTIPKEIVEFCELVERGGVKKYPNQFSMSQIIRIFLIYFPLKNTYLGAN